MKPDPQVGTHLERVRFLIKHLRITDLLPVALLLLATLSLACGKVGAPVAPARITVRTQNLTAIQRGDRIVLSWPAPPLIKQQDNRSYIHRVDIYRLVEQRDQEPLLNESDYEEAARVVGSLDRAMIEKQVKATGKLQYSDVVNMSSPKELANLRLRYAVRYVNKREQTAPFSNTVAFEPVPGISEPPGDVQLADQAQNAVTISWSAPKANVDSTEPASIVGYNIYRRTAKREDFGKPLNSEPVTDTKYTDTKFRYQVEYNYVVRALSQGATGLIESADSPALTFKPIDTFAPLPPDPVSIASANAVISLFWPTSPEADVIGYNIYRTDAMDAPEKDWVKLTAQPIATVTYHDDKVTPDQRYYYRVTAVDQFNNESKSSNIVSETANR